MDKLLIVINRLRRNIRNSPGCEYLYSRFDDLVEMLESKMKLTDQESVLLSELIRDYAVDSRYNNYTSPNWMRYSAICFYCADRLAKYMVGIHKVSIQKMLNRYFFELIDSRVAPIVQQEVLYKYLQMHAIPSNSQKLYGVLISKAIDECSICRYWKEDDVSLAWTYTQSAYSLVMDYLKIHSDYSVLKEWIPLFDTVALANYWYEYPDSCNYNHTRPCERQRIIEILDKMLDIHLKLLSFWYWHSPQELVDTLSLNYLIEILEVEEDEEFTKILHHMVTLPKNEKVEGILKHFEHDDELWIVELSKRLLDHY